MTTTGDHHRSAGNRRVRRRAAGAVVLALLGGVATACPPTTGGGGGTSGPATILMLPSQSKGYFSMPWPNDLRRADSGMIGWSSLPGIEINPLVEPVPKYPILPAIMIAAEKTVNQFGRNSAVFLQATAELDPTSLPGPAASTSASAAVQLIDLDTGERAPAVVVNQERADRFRPAHLLTVLPYPGHPLRSDARYAVMVFDDVTTTAGVPLAPAPALAELRAPFDAAATMAVPMTAAQHAALSAQLADVDAAISAHTTHDTGELVGFTVYRTQRTEREWEAIVESINAEPTPPVTITTLGPCVQYPDEGNASLARATATIPLPVWRSGTYPYLLEGGKVEFNADGSARRRGTRVSNVELSIPCGAEPAGGWPVATYMEGTGGTQAIASSPGVVAKASVLYGQMSPLYGVDVGDAGPLLTAIGFPPGDPQAEVLFYNLLNPNAIRTNPLQQASDQLIFTRALGSFTLDRALLGGSGTLTTNPTRSAITGHSQGAQTLPIIASGDPSIDVVISSAGSGGQYHSLAHSPRRLSTISLVTNGADRMDELNPLVQMIQTVFEAADGTNYLTTQHFLNYSGANDTCVPIETATHFAMSQGLATVTSIAGTSYGDTALDRITATAPVTANSSGKTRVQLLLPGGHFVSRPNKALSTAFMNSALTGVAPTVPANTAVGSSNNCPGLRYDDPPRLFGI